MNRNIFYAILSALGIILVARIAIIILNLFYTLYLFDTLSVEQLTSNTPSLTSTIIFWVSRLLEYAAYILAGWVIARRIKKNVWFYGGLVGLIWIILTYMLVIFYSLTIVFRPDNLLSKYPQISEKIKQKHLSILNDTFTSNIPQKLISASFIIGLTTLGGVLAEKRFGKRKLK